MVQDSAASSSRVAINIFKVFSVFTDSYLNEIQAKARFSEVCSPTTPICIGLGCSPVARRY